jgi:bifunctional enzyme CysN/CysC
VSTAELLARHEDKDLLRLLTAGSVDDGKSTLIGRLLYDSKLVYEDHLASLARDSKRIGSAGGEIDYSLLTDGLKAEREQGITIDVAYRYFSTPRRKFIIADCPGHEQYTRNMATGASTADLAIILVDAAHGVLAQTRRHSFITSLLGISHIVVAINKMDLVDYDEAVFERIRADYLDFAARLEVKDIHFIPISALAGDNVVTRSEKMKWYGGAPLLTHLETVNVGSTRNFIDLRFPVQYVLRQTSDFRGYCGTVASGVLRRGAEVLLLPSRRRTTIERIATFDGDLEEAFPPMAVTVQLADDVDLSRGDMIVRPDNVPTMAADIEAIVVWMNDAPLEAERPYLLKHGTSEVRAEVTRLSYKFDINELSRKPAVKLDLNEIGRAHLRLSRPLAFDAYARNRATGAFILIDPTDNVTVGAGMIIDRRSNDTEVEAPEPGPVRERKSQVSPAERAAALGHPPATIWLTGLPRAGKSTISFALERALFDAGVHALVLDGENLRLGLSRDLGFAALERSENVRRAAHVARTLNDVGVVAIVALVSPYALDREDAKRTIGDESFYEVHVRAPVEICEARDTEGLYAKARTGEIPRFTGVSAPYEAPTAPSLTLATDALSIEESVAQLMALLRAAGVLPAQPPVA